MLHLPPSPSHRRPPDLLYAADEKLPQGVLWVLGGQHAITAMAFITYVLVTARIAGLDGAGTQSMVAMALIGMALCTALQAWGGRWGAGALLVHMPNPFLITFIAAMVTVHGPGAIAVITVLYGAVALLVGPLMSRLRAFFPPAVVGTVVALGGLSLIEPAVRHALGLNAQLQADVSSVVIAMVTLGCIMAMTVWGGKRLRIWSLLLGIAVGVLVAGAMGKLQGWDVLAQAPVVALPQVAVPVLYWDWALVVAVGLVAILTQLDTLGSVIMMQKMDDAGWVRADMKMVAGGIRANAVGDMAAGFFGAFPSCTSSTNIAMAHATRSTARRVGLVAALLLGVAAFLPQLTLALTMVPEPVLGAVEMYAACFLIVSGFELVTSRAMDSRGIFTVGLSVVFGMAVMLLPKMVENLPQSWHLMASSGMVVGGVLVIALNACFRLGSRRTQTLDVSAVAATELHQTLTDFVHTQGAAWGARRDVVQRAALALQEAVEVLSVADRLPLLAVRGSFDEFNFDLELAHAGKPLQLGAPKVLEKASLDMLDWDEDALEQRLQAVSMHLLRTIADKVTSSSESAHQAVLRLHFAH